jgi:hypothetical protein
MMGDNPALPKMPDPDLRRGLPGSRIPPARARTGAQASLVHDVAAADHQRHLFFDPDVHVGVKEFEDIEEFEDIVGRNFRQPEEGLGFDGSPVAHMWRAMIWPNNFL